MTVNMHPTTILQACQRMNQIISNLNSQTNETYLPLFGLFGAQLNKICHLAKTNKVEESSSTINLNIFKNQH